MVRAELGVQPGDLERASARAAPRRGWTAARRTGRPAGRARWPGRWRRAGAGRRTARAGWRSSSGVDLQHRRPPRRRRARSRRASARPQLQPEGHVLEHRHVRVERVGLEHHGDAALGRRQSVDALAADADLAGGDVLEPGDQAQQRGLAAAGRPDEDDELAVGDVEVDAVRCTSLRAERLADLLELHRATSSAPPAQPLTAPAVRPATMRRWKTSTSTTSGSVTMTEAAMMLPHGSS